MDINILDDKLTELDSLYHKINRSSMKKQEALILDIYDEGFLGQQKLLALLVNRKNYFSNQLNWIDGLMFNLLLESNDHDIVISLKTSFKEGLLPLKSDYNIEYMSLQELLIARQFQKADELTQMKLCELSRICSNHSRKWLYFTDIFDLPIVDLITIDKLWNIYSKGLFGISVQRNIWIANKCNWEEFWLKIGWKSNDIACRYPEEFIWDLTAPSGHLPLFNQLRGVQVLCTLFSHKAWTINLDN